MDTKSKCGNPNVTTNMDYAFSIETLQKIDLSRIYGEILCSTVHGSPFSTWC